MNVLPFHVKRQSIDALQVALEKLPQVQLALSHIFAEGLYARVMHIPAGVCLVGAEHKKGHINVLLQGDIAVATDEGEITLHAPQIFAAPAGTKRAGVALTDTLWVSIHATLAETVMAAEDELVKDSDKLQNRNRLEWEGW